MLQKREEKICETCEKPYLPWPQSTKSSYCSKKCMALAHTKIIRRWRILEECLMPEENLATIGRRYGISRERVRQIVKKGGINHIQVKNGLMNESDKFRCVVCGMPKPKSKLSSTYCSKRCRLFIHNYDLSRTKTCQQCKLLFYPFRSEQYVKSLKGKYCSMRCYIKSNKEISRNFLEKFEKRFERFEKEL